MARPDPLDRDDVRRVAVAAQGFGPRPATVTAGMLRRLLFRLGAVQIDAVNVLIRAHYLALYSRLGPYPPVMLDRLVHDRRHGFEYWAHAASIVPIELYPRLRYRMTASEAEHDAGWARFLQRVEGERPGYAAAVLAEVADRGPLSFSELSDPARRPRGNPSYAASTLSWDRGSDGKTVLSYLYDSGRIAVAERRGFDRRFDLTERVIPAAALAASVPTPAEARRGLVEHAARALGVAGQSELRDYFRLPAADTRAAIQDLVTDGILREVRPEGWSEPGYVPANPWPYRGPPRCTLLSPFDSLLWHRERVKRIWGFTHSFEIYRPPAKRQFGYFVLPVLLGNQLVGRVDLKAERATRTLEVRGSYAEPGTPDFAGPLAAELWSVVGWLDLDTVTVAPHGDIAPALAAAVRALSAGSSPDRP